MQVTHRIAMLATLATLTTAAEPAAAQSRSWNQDARVEGYSDGVRAGRDDSQDGRRFEYQRHRDYRDADQGYDRRDGSREAYRRDYRAGFAAGYRNGYYASGTWRDGRGAPRRGDGLGAQVAAARGRDEGYRKGYEDGRDRDPRDVWRHGWYRDGDRGYKREYGSRELYERAYRAAFERGYDDGYQDGRRRRDRR